MTGKIKWNLKKINRQALIIFIRVNKIMSKFKQDNKNQPSHVYEKNLAMGQYP